VRKDSGPSIVKRSRGSKPSCAFPEQVGDNASLRYWDVDLDCRLNQRPEVGSGPPVFIADFRYDYRERQWQILPRPFCELMQASPLADKVQQLFDLVASEAMFDQVDGPAIPLPGEIRKNLLQQILTGKQVIHLFISSLSRQ
jgi:hypothetical protein